MGISNYKIDKKLCVFFPQEYSRENDRYAFSSLETGIVKLSEVMDRLQPLHSYYVILQGTQGYSRICKIDNEIYIYNDYTKEFIRRLGAAAASNISKNTFAYLSEDSKLKWIKSVLTRSGFSIDENSKKDIKIFRKDGTISYMFHKEIPISENFPEYHWLTTATVSGYNPMSNTFNTIELFTTIKDNTNGSTEVDITRIPNWKYGEQWIFTPDMVNEWYYWGGDRLYTNLMSSIKFNEYKTLPTKITDLYSFLDNVKDRFILNPEKVWGITANGILKWCNSPDRDLVIPEGVITIPDQTYIYGDGRKLFSSNIVSVTCPSTLKYIGNRAFQNSNHLRSVTLNEGLETLQASVFLDCNNLREIELPSTLKAINNHCFQETAISNLYIPASVETVGSRILWRGFSSSNRNINTTIRCGVTSRPESWNNEFDVIATSWDHNVNTNIRANVEWAEPMAEIDFNEE